MHSPTVENQMIMVMFSESAACLNTGDDVLDVLKVQLQEFTELLVGGSDGGGQKSDIALFSAVGTNNSQF